MRGRGPQTRAKRSSSLPPPRFEWIPVDVSIKDGILIAREAVEGSLEGGGHSGAATGGASTAARADRGDCDHTDADGGEEGRILAMVPMLLLKACQTRYEMQARANSARVPKKLQREVVIQVRDAPTDGDCCARAVLSRMMHRAAARVLSSSDERIYSLPTASATLWGSEVVLRVSPRGHDPAAELVLAVQEAARRSGQEAEALGRAAARYIARSHQREGPQLSLQVPLKEGESEEEDDLIEARGEPRRGSVLGASTRRASALRASQSISLSGLAASGSSGSTKPQDSRMSPLISHLAGSGLSRGVSSTSARPTAAGAGPAFDGGQHGAAFEADGSLDGKGEASTGVGDDVAAKEPWYLLATELADMTEAGSSGIPRWMHGMLLAASMAMARGEQEVLRAAEDHAFQMAKTALAEQAAHGGSTIAPVAGSAASTTVH